MCSICNSCCNYMVLEVLTCLQITMEIGQETWHLFFFVGVEAATGLTKDVVFI